jgi:hypothetical protein
MKHPKTVWADYDPHQKRADRWAYYTTKAEQRSNRPDLQPIKLSVRGVARKGGAK